MRLSDTVLLSVLQATLQSTATDFSVHAPSVSNSWVHITTIDLQNYSSFSAAF